MNYGLWMASSGIATAMYRLDVSANNLANVETTAFKTDYAMARQRDAAAIEHGLSNLPSNKLLERLGAGALMAPNRMSTAQGSLETTGRELDLAISGEGFLVVKAGPTTKPSDLRLTRDGRLNINGDGLLVQASSGHPVLDANDQPIRLTGGGHVKVQADGTIFQGREIVAKLGVAAIPDTSSLRKAGGTLMSAPDTQLARRRDASGVIEQAMIEKSTVDPVRTMLDVTSAERSIAYGAKVIQTIDETMQRAINVLGRVA